MFSFACISTRSDGGKSYQSEGQSGQSGRGDRGEWVIRSGARSRDPGTLLTLCAPIMWRMSDFEALQGSHLHRGLHST
jgi:hypothetical protein